MIAQYCGKPTLYSSENGWISDPKRVCSNSDDEILKYCQKKYPQMKIFAVSRSKRPVSITSWCAFNEEMCLNEKPITIFPYFCEIQYSEILDPNDDIFVQESDYTNIFKATDNTKLILANSNINNENLLQEIVESSAEFSRYFEDKLDTTLQFENNRFNKAKLANILIFKRKELMLDNQNGINSKALDNELWTKTPSRVQPLEDSLIEGYRKNYRQLYKDLITNHDRLFKTHSDRVVNILATYENQFIELWESMLNNSPTFQTLNPVLENLIRTLQFLRLHEINRLEALREEDPQEAYHQLPLIKIRLQHLSDLLNKQLKKIFRIPDPELRKNLRFTQYSVMAEYFAVNKSAEAIMAMSQDGLLATNGSIHFPSNDEHILEKVEEKINKIRHHLDPIVGKRVVNKNINFLPLLSTYADLNYSDQSENIMNHQMEENVFGHPLMRPENVPMIYMGQNEDESLKREKREIFQPLLETFEKDKKISFWRIFGITAAASFAMIGSGFFVRMAMQRYSASKIKRLTINPGLPYTISVSAQQYDTDYDGQELEFDEFIENSSWKPRWGFENPSKDTNYKIIM